MQNKWHQRCEEQEGERLQPLGQKGKKREWVKDILNWKTRSLRALTSQIFLKLVDIVVTNACESRMYFHRIYINIVNPLP